MNIPSYQMHNILNAYSRQLRRNRSTAPWSRSGVAPHLDRISLSSEGKRRTALKRVSEDILTYMNNLSAESPDVRPRLHSGAAAPNQTKTDSDHPHRQFEFHVIEGADTKIRNVLSIEDFSSFLGQTQRKPAGRSDSKLEGGRETVGKSD